MFLCSHPAFFFHILDHPHQRIFGSYIGHEKRVIAPIAHVAHQMKYFVRNATFSLCQGYRSTKIIFQKYKLNLWLIYSLYKVNIELVPMPDPVPLPDMPILCTAF